MVIALSAYGFLNSNLMNKVDGWHCFLQSESIPLEYHFIAFRMEVFETLAKLNFIAFHF